MTEPTALAQLRHLYQNMANGAVRDTASAKRIAEGLLAPAIEALERGTPPAAQGDALDAAFEAVRHRLCGMQRYSFVLDDDGVVRRVEDRTGRWIEFDDAHELFDPVAVDAARSQAKEGGAA